MKSLSFTVKQIIVISLLLLGFAIRVYPANDVGISPDDRNVINNFLDLPLPELLTATTHHNFPENILANLFIWVANKIGWQLLILRWPGIIFSCLALAMIHRFTRQVLGRQYALAALGLLTLSYYHVFFTYPLRGYAAMIFFAIASFYLLWNGLHSQQQRYWWLYSLTVALGIYNHFFFGTLLAIQGVIVAGWLIFYFLHYRLATGTFIKTQVLPPLLAGVGGVVLALLFFAPLLPRFFTSFVAADSQFTVSATSMAETFTPYLGLFEHYSSIAVPWAPTLFSVLAVVGMIHLTRHKPATAGMLAGWLGLPVLMVVLSLTYISWFYIRERYLVYMLPAFIILAATGWVGVSRAITKISRKSGFAVFYSIMAGVVASSAISLTNLPSLSTGQPGGAQNWPAVANYLAAKAAPIDMYLCQPFTHGWKSANLDESDDCTLTIKYLLDSQIDFIYPIYNLPAVVSYDTFAQNPIIFQQNPKIWIVLWQLPDNFSYTGQLPNHSFDKFEHTVLLGPIQEDNVISTFIRGLQDLLEISNDPATRFALLIRLAELQAAINDDTGARITLDEAQSIGYQDNEASAQIEMVEQLLEEKPLINIP